MSDKKIITSQLRWKKLLTGLVTIFLVVLIGTASLFYIKYQQWKKSRILEPGKTIAIVIPYGTSWSKAVNVFRSKGLVKHPIFFKCWSVESKLASRARAGSYLFQGPLYLDDLRKLLLKGGNNNETVVMIPEGYSIFQIADRLENLHIINRKEFQDAVTDAKLLKELGIPGSSFEGYLYPDTYRFKKGISAEAIVRTLYHAWQNHWDKLMRSNQESYIRLTKSYNFDIHKFVTLASIIERETDSDEELPIIARVFYNRLRRGMKLQTDPTCVYGPKTYKEAPSPALCKDPLNRYSTYVIKGLPPGPISNPGEAALRAVLKPDDSPEAKNYLYFVARPDRKGHTFSASYRAHKKAVQRLR